MINKLTCIECPKGCQLLITIENNQVVKVEGNQCEKGLVYAKQETENPKRTLTATVLTKNLSLKLVPVRTNQEIPKDKINEAMKEINKAIINQPIKIGEVVIKNILNLGVDVIATREANALK